MTVKKTEYKAKPVPRYRYEITSVWGKVPLSVKVGTVIRDKNMGDQHSWDIVDLNTGQFVWGFSGKFIGMAED